MKDFVTNHPQIVKVAPTVPPPSHLAVALLRDVCWWHCCGWRWQVTIKMPTLSGWSSDNNLALKTSETTDYRRNFWDPPSQTTASYHAIIDATDVLNHSVVCCSVADRKPLRKVINTAQRTVCCRSPSLEDTQCLSRAKKIIKDPSHSGQHLFTSCPQAVQVHKEPDK